MEAKIACSNSLGQFLVIDLRRIFFLFNSEHYCGQSALAKRPSKVVRDLGRPDEAEQLDSPAAVSDARFLGQGGHIAVAFQNGEVSVVSRLDLTVGLGRADQRCLPAGRKAFPAQPAGCWPPAGRPPFWCRALGARSLSSPSSPAFSRPGGC